MRSTSRRAPYLDLVRRCGLALLALLPFSVGACASEPIDLVKEYCPRTQVVASEPPLTSCWIKLLRDQRPVKELGRRSFLGESTLQEQHFRAPVAESILTAFARDLRDMHVFNQTSLYDRGQDYRLEIIIEHATASFTEGIPSLVPVLPSSPVEAHIRLRVTLLDRDGREFYDRAVDRSDQKVAAALSGLESTAAELYGRLLREAIDEVGPELRRSVTTFWSRYPTSRPSGP